MRNNNIYLLLLQFNTMPDNIEGDIEIENNVNPLIKTFILPIEMLTQKTAIPDSMKTDLELVKTDNVDSLYKHILSPKTEFGNLIMSQQSKYYTDDTNFLKDTQQLIKQSDFTYNVKYSGEYKSNHDKEITANKIDENVKKSDNLNDKILTLWGEIKNDSGFLERYQYIDFEFFKFLNNNEKFLQFLSIFNLSSPFLSLCFPLIMLILPFF